MRTHAPQGAKSLQAGFMTHGWGWSLQQGLPKLGGRRRVGAPGLFQRLGRGFQRCQLLRLPGLQDCHLLLQLAPLLLLLPVGASERQDQGAAGRVWTAEPGNSAPPQGTAPPPHPGQRRGRSGAPRGRGYVLAGSGHPSGKAWPALHLLPIFQVGEMKPRDTPAVSRGRLRGGGGGGPPVRLA